MTFSGIRTGALAAAALALVAVPAPASAVTYKVLYSFTGIGADGGRDSEAPLIIDSNGVLYGTTTRGGAHPCPGGCGTVFKLTRAGTKWTHTNLLLFSELVNGAFPFAPLMMDKNGALYGTSSIGGPSGGAGTVFRLTPPASGNGAWTANALRTFNNSRSDGGFLYGEVIADKNGALYGMASGGGARGKGTLYQLTPAGGSATWPIKVLYNFTPATGTAPSSGLVADSKGNLYGVADQGGSDNAGVAFRLSPPAKGKTAWTYTALHQFVGGFSDGQFAHATLLLRDGYLYGMTIEGGTNNAGTVFSIRLPFAGHPNPVYTLLHSFDFTTEGGQIYSGLAADAAGNLYGTASAGGSHSKGTVFKLARPAPGHKVWNLTVLHNFAGAPNDGGQPFGGLVMDKTGTLYGTTSAGGSHDFGTVFALKP